MAAVPVTSDRPRILVATLGGSWQVVPEVLGVTNAGTLDLYGGRYRGWELRPVNEVWVATTGGEGLGERAWQRLVAWHSKARAGGLRVRLRRFRVEGVADVASAEDARHMAELLHRVLWWARERCGPSGVVLSLAGGRKTMSADLQRAGQFFGHGGLLHVLERERLPEEEDLLGPLPAARAGVVEPVLLEASNPGSDLLAQPERRDELRRVAGEVPEGAEFVLPRRTAFVDAVESLQRRAQALLVNYGLQLGQADRGTNLRALYTLPARIVEALRDRPLERDRDEAWVRALPKPELHCHLGGVLSVPEIVGVAASLAGEVAQARRARADLDEDLRRVEAMARAEDLEGLAAWLSAAGEPDCSAFKALRSRWRGLSEPLGVCGFVLAFAGREPLLDALVFGRLRDPAQFRAVGIECYEALGDLQGSGLLQHEATIRAAMDALFERARTDGVRYLELRCSPCNYTRGGLAADQVVDRLLEAAERFEAGGIDLRLLFIASRHGTLELARKHVDLARRRLDDEDERFARRFVGFDLAGAEGAARPSEFRALFRDLHERVVRITVHAGETEPVESVWEAVYELNADRVGHGLTLIDDDALRARFRERRIAVELCPSSNFQIGAGGATSAGYRDRHLGVGDAVYPLRTYLDEGMRVTINTDDPGMSRTTLTGEYFKAAAMMSAGAPLTRWDVLQLAANGYRAAFCREDDRKRLLDHAESRIIEQLLEEFSS